LPHNALRCTRVALAAAALSLISAWAADAQTITSGAPGLLRITTAVPGSQPTSVSVTTNYTVTTPNPAGRTYKVTASLNANMPTNVTLTATFVAPPGGTSVGPVVLDVTARDVVTGIPRSVSSTQNVSYQLDANVLAGVIANTSRQITLTILRFP
jgi:hypothetical protein